MKHSVLAIMLVLAMTITPFTEGKADMNITGKEIVKCNYDAAQECSEGMAVVDKNGKWYVIPIE